MIEVRNMNFYMCLYSYVMILKNLEPRMEKDPIKYFYYGMRKKWCLIALKLNLTVMDSHSSQLKSGFDF